MEASKDTLVQSGACDSSSVYQVHSGCQSVRVERRVVCVCTAGTDFRLLATDREASEGHSYRATQYRGNCAH